MRAHVEVDDIVRFTCLDAALRLKEEFKHICEVQISGMGLLLKFPFFHPYMRVSTHLLQLRLCICTLIFVD